MLGTSGLLDIFERTAILPSSNLGLPSAAAAEPLPDNCPEDFRSYRWAHTNWAAIPACEAWVASIPAVCSKSQPSILFLFLFLATSARTRRSSWLRRDVHQDFVFCSRRLPWTRFFFIMWCDIGTWGSRGGCWCLCPDRLDPPAKTWNLSHRNWSYPDCNNSPVLPCKK